MKPRHAAALALVGWYLMSPPFPIRDQSGRGLHADPNAPLTEWYFYHEYHKNCCHIYDRTHALEFKTFDECDQLRKGFYDAWFGTNGRPGVKDHDPWDTSFIDERSESIQYEKCVPSDDPRLAK